MRSCANLEIHQGDIGEIVPFDVPNTIQCPKIEDISINVHHWDAVEIKSNCFDYCELYTAFQIKHNLGADGSIIPLLHDTNAMLDFSDENGLWAAIVTVLKSKIPTKELDMNRHSAQSTNSHKSVNMSRFLEKLEY